MTVDMVKELRDGLAKLPKGPWRHSPWHIEEDFDAVRVADGWILCTLSSAEYAKHIARCSGENIAALLDQFEAIRAENERLKALLRQNFCPRPANNRPDHFEIGACIDADECGCINCDAGLRSSTETDR